MVTVVLQNSLGGLEETPVRRFSFPQLLSVSIPPIDAIHKYSFVIKAEYPLRPLELVDSNLSFFRRFFQSPALRL
jgi:hypothetical protein